MGAADRTVPRAVASWPRREGAARSLPLAALLSLLALCSYARAEELPRGRVVERVETLADASQSYALYLPSNYDRGRAWPVLFCFDPLGRGRVPVELFREAAEKRGWIVVGSNNSRNGPLRPSLEAAEAVLKDAQARFALDARRVYSAGFSGGARLALRVSSICRDCLAGVVAVGAGFPPDLSPDPSRPLALFLAAGADDFNYAELKTLDERLARLSFPHRLAVFDGSHAWAPAEVCARAVEWMELQAMRSGRREADAAFVEELWRAGLGRAAADEAAGRKYEAYLGYRALAGEFAGLRADASDASERAARLGASKEVRRAAEDEERQVRRQTRLFSELLALTDTARGGGGGEAAVALSSFRAAVEGLRKASRAADDTGERRVARRTLGQLSASFYERAGNARDRGESPSRVAADLELAAEVAPDHPRLLFELACAYALDGRRAKALATLTRALDKGFTDADALTNSEALNSLRDEPVYRELLRRLRR